MTSRYVTNPSLCASYKVHVQVLVFLAVTKPILHGFEKVLPGTKVVAQC